MLFFEIIRARLGLAPDKILGGIRTKTLCIILLRNIVLLQAPGVSTMNESTREDPTDVF